MQTRLHNPGLGTLRDLGPKEEACTEAIRAHPRNGATHLPSWPDRSEGGQPCQLLHPKERPATVAISSPAPPQPQRDLLHGPTRDLHPSRWRPHLFPGSSGSGFRVGYLQAQRTAIQRPCTLLFFLRACRFQSKSGWCRSKARQAGSKSQLLTRRPGQREPLLSAARSPHLLNGGGGIHLTEGRKGSHSGLQSSELLL